MSKKPVVSAVVSTDPVSMRDASYRFALSGESRESIVRYVLGVAPSFADEITKETRAELYAGFQLRKHELVGEKLYKVVDGGNLIPVEDPTLPGLVQFTINSAMSYTSSEFGKLRETDPAKHAVIKSLRDSFGTYASNALKDMQRLAKRLTQGDAPRARAVNKDFREAVKAQFETLDKRVKTALARGDADADPVKFRMAVAAFWEAYDK